MSQQYNNVKSTKVFESLKTNGISDKNDKSNTGSYFKLNKNDAQQIAGFYELEETIGQGHFAVVKSARHTFSGEKVAIKVIDKSKLDKLSKEHLFQEVRCMKLVQHPNVVRLYEVIDTPTKLYLILEFGDGGDMYDYIMKHSNGLSEVKSRNYFRQIVRAVKYCHDLHVVHRDLKPENVVFFEQTGQVKLTDFGFSNVFVPGTKLLTSCGSLAYSAPEILLGDSYDAPAVDIWSIGVILYMLVTGRAPFQEASDSETLTMILDCKYLIPSYLSFECKDLISKMIVRNPENRIKLEEIIKHDWLKEVSNEATPQESSDDTDTNTLQIKKAKLKKESEILNMIPLVKREHLCKKDNDEIIESMVKGNVSTKEEIIRALDEDNYNYITATYYLLAENLLKKNYVRKKKQKTNRIDKKYTANKLLKTEELKQEKIKNLKMDQSNMSSVTEDIENETNTNRRKINVKSNFNNLLKGRNILKRQDEGVEEEDEMEEELKLSNFNKSTENLINSDESNKNASELIMLNNDSIASNIFQSQSLNLPLANLATVQVPHLTNILEDEEEIHTQPVSKQLIHTKSLTQDLNSNLVQFNTTSNTIVSLSRRSSRGGNSSDNAISTLTIPEEGETELNFTTDSTQIKMPKLNDSTYLTKINSTPSGENNLIKSESSYKSDENENNLFEELNQANKNVLSTNRQLNSDTQLQNANILINGTKNFPNFQVNNISLKKKRHQQFIKRVSSSGADTSCSDNSDTENLKYVNHNKDMLLIEDYDWNRTESSSSKSRSKFNRQNNSGLSNEKNRSRPLSVSSERTCKIDNNDLLDPTKNSAYIQNSVLRTKSLAEQPSDPSALIGKQNFSIFPSNSNEHISTVLSGVMGKGGTLSVEHRVSNMSQMSISSQLSKNNSIRIHPRSETPSQNQQHSATPTPRESIVFNRGDEKPIAKILLNLNSSFKSSQKNDKEGLLNNDEEGDDENQLAQMNYEDSKSNSSQNESIKSSSKILNTNKNQTNSTSINGISTILSLTEHKKQAEISHVNVNNKNDILIKSKIDEYNSQYDSNNINRANNDSYSHAIKNLVIDKNNKNDSLFCDQLLNNEISNEENSKNNNPKFMASNYDQFIEFEKNKRKHRLESNNKSIENLDTNINNNDYVNQNTSQTNFVKTIDIRNDERVHNFIHVNGDLNNQHFNTNNNNSMNNGDISNKKDSKATISSQSSRKCNKCCTIV